MEEVPVAQPSEQAVKEPKPIVAKPTARSRHGESLGPRQQTQSPSIEREPSPSVVKIQPRVAGDALEKPQTPEPPRSSVSPAPRASSGENDSHVRIVDASSPLKSYAPLYHLLGEFSQFQLALPSELKPLLNGTEEWFPASNLNANPSTQGEVLVIGVMGSPGSGKSSLLNAIASQCSPLSGSNQAAPTERPQPRPVSILQQLEAMNDKPQNIETSAPSPSTGPFPQRDPEITIKSLLPSNKSFSIDMAIVQRPNNRLFDLLPNCGLKRRVNESDCVILLEAQSLLQPSMLLQAKRGETVAVDVRNQDITLQLLSLQIGVFLLSVCNIVLAVDDSSCNSGLWKHVKTLEMLKWTFPEVSDLFHSAPSLPHLIPQLKQSFADARRSETYEKIMLEVVSKSKQSAAQISAGKSASATSTATADAATPPTTKKRERKRGKKSSATEPTSDGKKAAQTQNAKPNRSLAADLTIDEQKVSEISGALDAINLYSTDQEYLPALMFVFNKLKTSATSPAHQSHLQQSLAAFFARSSFLSSIPSLEGSGIPSSSASASMSKQIESIPFSVVGEAALPSHGAKADSFESTVQKILQLPAPRFHKPLNPREWLIAASWMWDLIRQSQVLADYHNALKQASSSRSLKEASVTS